MNSSTAKARLRNPDLSVGTEYRFIHDGLIDILDSWDASRGEDVEMFLVDVLLQMRSSINLIARDLGLLGTIVLIEEEQAKSRLT